MPRTRTHLQSRTVVRIGRRFLVASALVAATVLLPGTAAHAAGESVGSVTPNDVLPGASNIALTVDLTLDPAQSAYFVGVGGLESPSTPATCSAQGQTCTFFANGSGSPQGSIWMVSPPNGQQLPASVTLSFSGLHAVSTAGCYAVTVTGYTSGNLVDAQAPLGVGNGCAQPLPVPSGGGATSTDRVTISFNGNGGTCDIAVVSGPGGTWASAPASSACRRPDYYMTGWNTAPDGSGGNVTSGGSLHLTGDNMLYAQWIPALVPGSPMNVTATLTSASSALIAWQAPDQPGPLPVSYEVTASPGGLACTTRTLSCTITGLLLGTSYTVDVATVSAVGASAPVSTTVLAYDATLIARRSADKVVLDGHVAGLPNATTAQVYVTFDGDRWVPVSDRRSVVDGSGSFTATMELPWQVRGKPVRFKTSIAGKDTAPIVVADPENDLARMKTAAGALERELKALRRAFAKDGRMPVLLMQAEAVRRDLRELRAAGVPPLDDDPSVRGSRSSAWYIRGLDGAIKQTQATVLALRQSDRAGASAAFDEAGAHAFWVEVCLNRALGTGFTFYDRE